MKEQIKITKIKIMKLFISKIKTKSYLLKYKTVKNYRVHYENALTANTLQLLISTNL